jgi:GNAT superfamily N-acetyltransferase
LLALVPARDLDPEALGRFLATPDPPAGFRRSETPAYYRWLATASGEVETVALAAVEDGRIAGALFAVVRKTVVAGETIRTAKLEEMRTDPNQRGRGVMSLVFSGVRDACLERGAHVLLAGPTSPHSYPIFTKRLGFVEPFSMASFVRPLRIGPIRLARAGRGVDTPSKLPIDACAFSERLSVAARVAVLRSPEYLAWRYERHPDAYHFVVRRDRERVRGVAVWKETRQRGLRIANLVECLAETPRERGLLLSAVAGVAARDSSARLLTGFATLGLTPAALLRRGSWLRRSRTPILVWHDGSLPPAKVAALHDPGAWILSMGDFFDV